jgi:hypothetical protein
VQAVKAGKLEDRYENALVELLNQESASASRYERPGNRRCVPITSGLPPTPDMLSRRNS